MNVLWIAATGDWLHALIASIIAVLFLCFLFFVLFRASALLVSLKRLGNAVRLLTGKSPPLVKRELSKLFANSRLQPNWAEYEDTLHEQTANQGIDREIVAVRATVPAESFFNAELVVDSTLHTEFFKHLPGIFTGLGIIATFSGLIAGLQSFDVKAVEPDALKASLGGLFGHVGSAFLLSAVAIGLAMICTIVEKILYAANVHAITSIALALDGLFKSGVGEEYLSKLVRSSEDGAVQTKQLKESLVEDLKALLTNLTERQIEATHQLSNEIGASLETSLQVPLQKIADTVQLASQDQSASAGKMIENLMDTFMAQMRDTMGSQMGDLSGMMQQSAASIMRVEESLRRLVDDMQSATHASSEGIQRAMAELLSSLASHERQQSETLGGAQVQMLTHVQSAVERMASAQAAGANQVGEAAADATRRIVEASAEVQKAGEESSRRAAELTESIHDVTLESIRKLESGAAQVASMMAALNEVVDRLARTSGSLAGLHEQSGQLGSRLDQSSTSLRTSTDTLAIASQALSQASVRVEGVSSLMTTEASAREATLKDIQLALSKGQEAAREFGEYSDMLTVKLGDAMEQFGSKTGAVLNHLMTDFDKELGNAVLMLRDIVERMSLIAASDERRR
ncbi:anti-phage ZorAB system protein ZorA [Xanthomonas campestris]|uniref:Uncharacterized protein n=2 Tax=Xanthomonas campestris TaxID=339 RepID=A0A0H2XAR4_XANC8|nr:anti-phage ZorAB system protein ZorA [Xanthomonas campestris]AAY49837.1 conserved hypothetical protein [Xanthomonas campestris pv. campestris str. 8004]MBD8249367.1 anti-phage defense ZorAB system ZorA [Xanthomonas campestris]QCX67715.1 hypothetical protein DFG55_15940 [Xanthomonas campestris pv. campestris]QCX71789.1 hypothetical protein DFG54_14480 [Xanthomonas campestris pv. campestris]